MRKTNHGQPAIAARMPWRAGCFVAEVEPVDEMFAPLHVPGRMRNAMRESDALFNRLLRGTVRGA